MQMSVFVSVYYSTMCIHIIGIAHAVIIGQVITNGNTHAQKAKEKHKKLSKRRKGKESSDGSILLLICMFIIAHCLLSGNSLCCASTTYITHIFAWLCVR